MWKEFKAFVLRGNVMDLAVGVIIGAAFGAVIKSLVEDVIMPPIGVATGGVDFVSKYTLLKAGTKAPPPYASLADAKAAGAVTLNYGVFINTVMPERAALTSAHSPAPEIWMSSTLLQSRSAF